MALYSQATLSPSTGGDRFVLWVMCRNSVAAWWCTSTAALSASHSKDPTSWQAVRNTVIPQTYSTSSLRTVSLGLQNVAQEQNVFHIWTWTSHLGIFPAVWTTFTADLQTPASFSNVLHINHSIDRCSIYISINPCRPVLIHISTSWFKKLYKCTHKLDLALNKHIAHSCLIQMLLSTWIRLYRKLTFFFEIEILYPVWRSGSHYSLKNVLCCVCNTFQSYTADGEAETRHLNV